MRTMVNMYKCGNNYNPRPQRAQGVPNRGGKSKRVGENRLETVTMKIYTKIIYDLLTYKLRVGESEYVRVCLWGMG